LAAVGIGLTRVEVEDRPGLHLDLELPRADVFLEERGELRRLERIAVRALEVDVLDQRYRRGRLPEDQPLLRDALEEVLDFGRALERARLRVPDRGRSLGDVDRLAVAVPVADEVAAAGVGAAAAQRDGEDDCDDYEDDHAAGDRKGSRRRLPRAAGA